MNKMDHTIVTLHMVMASCQFENFLFWIIENNLFCALKEDKKSIA